ncbi:MAG: hypothetical protein ABIE94_03850 [archaeon]
MDDTNPEESVDLGEALRNFKATAPEPQTEPNYPKDRIATYRAFRDGVTNSQSVLHPSGGFDASPSKVFDNVTYVDIEDGNEGCVDVLRRAGLKAFRMDIREYIPEEEHDLLILLNPSISTEWAARHITSGAYIISNNYHGNASEMHNEPDKYTLWGTIDLAERDHEKGHFRAEVSRDLTDLFTPAESGEELRILRPDEYEFWEYSRRGILESMNIEPEERFEDMYMQFQRLMQEPEVLPSKRSSDDYIFVKK